MRKEAGISVARTHRRFAIFPLLAALLIAPIFAQTGNLNSMMTVVVQPTGDGSGRAEAVITNNSGKSIAAFTISLTTLAPTGSAAVSRLNVDLLPSYASASRSPRLTSKYQHFGPLENGEELFRIVGAPGSRITANVMAIVFDDNTAAGDRSWAQFNFDHHAAAAAELHALVGTLGSPSTSNLREQINTWRQALPQRWKARASLTPQTKGGASGIAFARNFVISKLAEASRDSLSDDGVATQFKDAISYLSDTADDMRRHSSIVEVRQ